MEEVQGMMGLEEVAMRVVLRKNERGGNDVK